MVDDQQAATGKQRFRSGSKDPGATDGKRGVEILRRDQVEPTTREAAGQVVAFGGYPVVDAEGLSPVRYSLRCGAGDVDRGHEPAVPGEPDGVPTGAASQVECRARREGWRPRRAQDSHGRP